MNGVADTLSSDEQRLKDYDHSLDQICSNSLNLKHKIAETEKKKREEIDTQNRLEIEKNDIEDIKHISMFALYD